MLTRQPLPRGFICFTAPLRVGWRPARPGSTGWRALSPQADVEQLTSSLAPPDPTAGLPSRGRAAGPASEREPWPPALPTAGTSLPSRCDLLCCPE